MNGTRESILNVSLKLFASCGYEAVSVSMIAGELGMVKSALYRHFKNKRDILESIVARMEELDTARAELYSVPVGACSEMGDTYAKTALSDFAAFSLAQFRFWTEDDFASGFRRLLTLEQHRSPEMTRLYQQYLASGPLGYTEDIFRAATGDAENAGELALQFFGPLSLLYAVYDGSSDKPAVTDAAARHINKFIHRISGDIKKQEVNNGIH